MEEDEEDDELFLDASSGEPIQTTNQSDIYGELSLTLNYVTLLFLVTPREIHAQKFNRANSTNTPMRKKNLVPPSIDFSDSSETPEDPLHTSPKPMNLEEIERLARQQEKGLFFLKLL